MSYSSLKKRRSKNSNIEKLQKALDKDSNSFKDDRIWSYEMDKTGKAGARLRFLPSKNDEDLPWAQVFTHGFKGDNGRWYIENCPTTVGRGDDCPICASNGKLWNSGLDSDKEIVRSRKRRLSYYSNILVVEDKAHPENEGKVFLWRYGKKVFDKIKASMDPDFDDETAINPFDFWEGADFVLRIRKVDGYANYDKSSFDTPSELFDGDDKKLEELYKSLYDLSEFTDDKDYKTFSELVLKFKVVVGDEEAAELLDLPTMETVETSTNTSSNNARPSFNENVKDEAVEEETAEEAESEEAEVTAEEKEGEEEDEMAFFTRMAENEDD